MMFKMILKTPLTSPLEICYEETNIEKEDLSEAFFQNNTRQLVVLDKHRTGGLPRAAMMI
jgi:hypothetical protein